MPLLHLEIRLLAIVLCASTWAPIARAAAPHRLPAAAPVDAKHASASPLDSAPMAFERNVGQFDASVRFLARGKGYAVFVTRDELVLALPSSSDREASAAVPTPARRPPPAKRERLGMRFVGARAGAEPSGATRASFATNYLVGNDPDRWRHDVDAYESLRVPDVYPGVDAVLRGTQHELEYDFEVAPGADPSAIRVRFDGHAAAHLDENGDLDLDLGAGSVRQHRPLVYQPAAAGKRPVAARYTVGAHGDVGFEIGAYDRSAPLVIDPILSYAEYLSGSADVDEGSAIAVDAAGAVYVVGSTESNVAFVSGGSPFQPEVAGASDAFVYKFDPEVGTVYCTFLGGTSDDVAYGVAVDASGSAYVTRYTFSSGFPTTPGAFDPTYNGSSGTADAFVAKLSPDGSSLAYSTFLGATSNGNAVVVDAAGEAFVVGESESSSDFPVTPGAFDTDGSGPSGFVTKLDATGSALSYSTFIGGPLSVATGVAVDAAGRAYVGGYSQGNLQTTQGAFDTTFGGGPTDGFVAKLDASGSTLLYGTYLGGVEDDTVFSVDVDASGAAYATGWTSSADFPTTSGAAQPAHGGTDGRDAYVTKLDAAGGALVYSTFLGGSGSENGLGIDVDAAGAAYVTGNTISADFPTTPGAYHTSLADPNSGDAFVTKVSATGDAFDYSTYLGGSGDDTALDVAVASDGVAWITGASSSPDYTSSPNGHANPDVIVTGVDPSGSSLVLSERFGGEGLDDGASLAATPDGGVLVLWYTQSTDFFVSPAQFDPHGDLSGDMVVTKLNALGAPEVVTYLGGSSSDVGAGVAVTSSGEVIVAASTHSQDYPTTPGAFDTTPNGGTDVAVTRLDASLTSLVYSTYLGSPTDDDALSLAFDGTSAYVVGVSSSPAFPTTPGAYDAIPNGRDGFCAKLAANGSSLVYATFLGGATRVNASALAVDAAGDAYVTGSAGSGLATTSGAFQTSPGGSGDAFVLELNPTGSAAPFATYLGGAALEIGRSIDLGEDGAIYAVGVTESANFPTTPGALDTTYNGGGPIFGGGDVYVTKLAPGGASLVYSTYYGGSDSDYSPDVEVDSAGDAYVCGSTLSTDLSLTSGAFFTDPVFGLPNGFVLRLDATGSTLDFASYLGGLGGDTEARAIALGPDAEVYVGGRTYAPGFATDGYGPHDLERVFVAKLTFASSDSPGVVVPSTSTWFLKNVAAAGGADYAFQYGGPGSGAVPLAGDWDGDGDDTPGLYVPATGSFFLRNGNSPGGADVVFTFGAGGAGYVPLVGDWDGNGTDTVGLYQPATGVFFLRYANASGGADATFTFGAGGAIPLSGDWNGDGIDTVGLYVPATGVFFLTSSPAGGAADTVFTFGGGGATPLSGDWNGDGVDTVGLYVSGSGAWFLTDRNESGPATRVFAYGPPGATPVVGDWDGR